MTDQGGSNVSYLYDFGYDNATHIQYDPKENFGKTRHRFAFDQSGMVVFNDLITFYYYLTRLNFRLPLIFGRGGRK